jgi:hypothetical protein
MPSFLPCNELVSLVVVERRKSREAVLLLLVFRFHFALSPACGSLAFSARPLPLHLRQLSKVLRRVGLSSSRPLPLSLHFSSQSPYAIRMPSLDTLPFPVCVLPLRLRLLPLTCSPSPASLNSSAPSPLLSPRCRSRTAPPLTGAATRGSPSLPTRTSSPLAASTSHSDPPSCPSSSDASTSALGRRLASAIMGRDWRRWRTRVKRC